MPFFHYSSQEWFFFTQIVSRRLISEGKPLVRRCGIVASDIFNQERPGSREDSSFTSGLKEASYSRGYLSTYRDVAPVAALGGLITVGAFHSVVE